MRHGERDNGVVWLTEESAEELRCQLTYLRGVARQGLIEAISAARDQGRMDDFTAYHALRDQQAMLEDQIVGIEHTLAVGVLETPEDDGIVKPGMRVTFQFEGDDVVDDFLLADRAVEATDLAVYSPQSPLGAALLGRQRGDLVTYTAPTGKVLSVEILDVVPYSSH